MSDLDARCDNVIKTMGGLESFINKLPVSIDKIAEALRQGDEYLNTIPLEKWDREINDCDEWPYGLSRSEKVCTLKRAAVRLASGEIDIDFKPLRHFIQDNQIFVTTQRIEERSDKTEWIKDARHWLVSIYMGLEIIKVEFSQGPAHTKPPTVEDVLNCLAMDSYSIEYAGMGKGDAFENWCSELGYDTDSRRAFATWELCKAQADELRTFLGEELYSKLIWKVRAD